MDSESTPQQYWDLQPMRREQDHIVVIESYARQVLLGTGDSSVPMPLTFTEAIFATAGQIANGMHELLVEIWLVDMPPWNVEDASHTLRAYASVAPQYSASSERRNALPDDILLSVVTAGRPLRFDDASTHPLVRAWAQSAGIIPDSISVFLGVPINYQHELRGVLAVAMAYPPSVEHIRLIDAVAEYIAMGAEHAYTSYMLHAQKELAQTVLRDAPIAAAVLRPGDYAIVLTNPIFDRLLHLGPDVWGQRLDDVLPDHGPRLRTSLHLAEVVQTGEPRTFFDLPIRLATGLTYWDFTCSPIRSTNNEIEGILIAGVDVTARVAQRQRQKLNVDVAQERVLQMVMLHQTAIDVSAQMGEDPVALLRQIIERMAQLVAAPGGLVYYADRETGDLEVVVSAGMSKDYTGWRLHKGEGLAGRVAIIGQGQYVENYQQFPMRATVFANEPFGAVAAVPMRQRGRIIGVICLIHPPMPAEVATGNNEDRVRYTFTDDDLWLLDLFAGQAAQAIENARTYQELEQAYQQQRALDRQKDDFIARVSHDLRLPLTSVIGYLDLALATARSGTHEDLLELLQQSADDAQNLAEMLELLLAQALLDSGKRELRLKTLHLGAVIDEVVQARQRQSELRGLPHHFVIRVEEIAPVIADLARLKEAMENVISNAVKYSPDGGEITITVYPAKDNRSACISIRDQGIGISQDERSALFRRFSRVESPLVSEIRGTGMGLYLAQQLIESMGGQIWLEWSVPGQGSEFVLTLPLAGDTPTPIS
jgi:signal transduction histidine kinase